MSISGWDEKYNTIIKEFNYNKNDDLKSAKLLNSLLRSNQVIKKVRTLIENNTIFVIGAGPSLSKSISIIKTFDKITKIVADGATLALIENKIRPDIVVTDLDGIYNHINEINNETVIIVHAHGDNINKLNIVTKLKNCIGTTETKPMNNIYNFGGFTDGDRCVFLASYFNAKNIITFGMDLGNKIGRYSGKKNKNRLLKIKKMKVAENLLGWLTTKNKIKYYTTSKKITGFKKIDYNDIENIIKSEF
ncbi:MAG: DUF115 domain-containing protein [Thaumarchaeota archaeon]|nr:DUF115 domain-containing protein [Nitrososphaerota archaeon]MCY3976097.1 DUF115 domain-containing protein [Nitrososphaerota archaeon]